MAVLTVQQIGGVGINPTLQAADVAGDSFAGDRKTFLEVTNLGGASITVTLVARKPYVNGVGRNITVTVNASNRFYIYVPPEWFQDGSTGLVSVTYSAVGSVSVGAFRVGSHGF